MCDCVYMCQHMFWFAVLISIPPFFTFLHNIKNGEIVLRIFLQWKNLHDIHLINKYLHSSMLSTWTNMSSILWTLHLFINTKIVYNFWHNSFLFSHLNRHNFHLSNVHFLDLYGFTLDTAAPESPGLPFCIFFVVLIP